MVADVCLTSAGPTLILRYVPKQHEDAQLVVLFRALADPTRLAVVERLSISPASATELSRPFSMALPSFMQHLQVLEDAGLVMSHKSSRTRTYQLQPDGLNAASTWLRTFRNHWDRRLDQLEQLLQPTDQQRQTNSINHTDEEPS